MNINSYLKNNWTVLTDPLKQQSTAFFEQLIKCYNKRRRHYHNLDHIQALLKLSEQYKDRLNSPETVNFSIWYHDAIYSIFSRKNEIKSAALAKDCLSQMGVEEGIISDCYNMIVATKTHQLPEDLNSFDARFFIDIDLSILAAERDRYMVYTKQVRRENWIFPGFLYKKGRKKILHHFLDTNRIYKTDLFFELWEQKARENLAYELSGL